MGLLKSSITVDNTIMLSLNESMAKYCEGISDDSVIMPGHLLTIFPPTSGSRPFVKRTVSASNTLMKMFAVENTRHGKTIDDAYASGDLVMYRVCRPGDVIMAWVRTHAAYPISIGTFLTRSSGTGYGNLMSIDDHDITILYPGGVVAIALEAVTGDVTSRLIKVQIV